MNDDHDGHRPNHGRSPNCPLELGSAELCQSREIRVQGPRRDWRGIGGQLTDELENVPVHCDKDIKGDRRLLLIIEDHRSGFKLNHQSCVLSHPRQRLLSASTWNRNLSLSHFTV